MTGRYKSNSPLPVTGRSGEKTAKRRRIGNPATSENEASNSPAVESPLPISSTANCSFKDPRFVQSSTDGNKKRTGKSLKQILAAERALPWKESDPNYARLDAPPSFKPAKHYSDLSGLPTTYKDPKTDLYYATSAEFAKIRQLPYEIIQGFLALRNALPQT